MGKRRRKLVKKKFVPKETRGFPKEVFEPIRKVKVPVQDWCKMYLNPALLKTNKFAESIRKKQEIPRGIKKKAEEIVEEMKIVTDFLKIYNII